MNSDLSFLFCSIHISIWCYPGILAHIFYFLSVFELVAVKLQFESGKCSQW
jgi:hypothetical protein